MRRHSKIHWMNLTLVALAPLLSIFSMSIPALGQITEAATAEDLNQGRVHYIASCSRCHGVEGGGGDGPPLTRTTLTRAPDDDALVRIMQNGISGTGMPGVGWLAPSELRQVAVYVRSLAPSGPDDLESLSGDPTRGRTVFENEGCMGCHTVRGSGTARGPDLSTVGARRASAYLRESIIDPAADLPRGVDVGATIGFGLGFVNYLMVRVVDNLGNQLRGIRMNEDSYTIQLKDAQGVLHSFYKPDLLELQREFDRSPMQSYRERLSEEELEDLVAYLTTLTGTNLRGIS